MPKRNGKVHSIHEGLEAAEEVLGLTDEESEPTDQVYPDSGTDSADSENVPKIERWEAIVGTILRAHTARMPPQHLKARIMKLLKKTALMCAVVLIAGV